MRKACRRQHRPLTAPMLVNRSLVEIDVETRERMLVQAFALGYATTSHYDDLADMRNVLTLAAAYKDDRSAQTMCTAMRIVMGNIRDRYTKTGRIGASGAELQLLKAFVGVYRDFWIRQPVALYEKACDELRRIQDSGALKMAAEVVA